MCNAHDRRKTEAELRRPRLCLPFVELQCPQVLQRIERRPAAGFHSKIRFNGVSTANGFEESTLVPLCFSPGHYVRLVALELCAVGADISPESAFTGIDQPSAQDVRSVAGRRIHYSGGAGAGSSVAGISGG